MGSTVKLNKTTEKIWDYFIRKFDGNEYAAAAVMGALNTLTEITPNYMDELGVVKYNIKKPRIYTTYVNNGIITMNEFVHDTVGYGIRGWTKWTSKQGLYNMARKEKKSIGSLDVQLDFLMDELQENAYKDVVKKLKKSTGIEKAVQIFVEEYVNKDGIYSIVAMNFTIDNAYGYYEAYAIGEKAEKKETSPLKGKQVVVAWANNVIVRAADSCKAKEVGVLRTDTNYKYIMSNEKKTWHCILFNDTLRWVSNKNTQVISV